MAIARAQVVDMSLTRWHHCVTRCIRKACLLGEGDNNRKEWLKNRFDELADVFAVAVGGFSVMDNHLHVLLWLDPDLAQAGSGKTAQWEAAKDGSAAGAQASADLEESLWLCPIEDRRGLDSTREGMIQGFPLGSYAKLVDYTGRLFRQIL
jgi:hypothetical protein